MGRSSLKSAGRVTEIIPLYVTPAVNGGLDNKSPETGKPELADALASWMKSSDDVRRPLDMILEERP